MMMLYKKYFQHKEMRFVMFMYDTDGWTPFTRFLFVYNPNILAIVRFVGIALGFAVALFLIWYFMRGICCEIKELINHICKTN